MKYLQRAFKSKARVGRGFAATLLFSTAIGGGVAGVGMQTMGAWPKWLGGTYVSADCDCTNYPSFAGHWLACRTKNLWGLNTTGWGTPEIHDEGTCASHGHTN